MSAASGVYEPPKQGVGGQLLDSVIILLLLFVVLFGVTYYTQSSASSAPATTKPVSQLPLTDAEKVQYQKLIDGKLLDLETANTQVLSQLPDNNKYPIDPVALLLTFGVVGAYFLFIYSVSFKQYREVVRERFGPPVAAGPNPEVLP